jgi:hypothetical protein
MYWIKKKKDFKPKNFVFKTKVSSYDNFYKPVSKVTDLPGVIDGNKANSKVSFHSHPVKMIRRNTDDSKYMFSIQEALSDYFIEEDDYLYEDEPE